MSVLADLNQTEDRIWVTFPYHPVLVTQAKTVGGYRFIDAKLGGPAWQYPLSLMTARALRDAFGEELVLGERLRTWAKNAVKVEKELSALATADDAELQHLPDVMPELAGWLRPYQRADVRSMAVKSMINANQPGLGKTVEAIGSVGERGADHYNGPQLVIAPKTSLETVWFDHIDRFSEHPCLYMSGDDSPAERREIIDLTMEWRYEKQPFWLVINPAFITFRRDKTQKKILVEGKLQYPLVPAYPEIQSIKWNSIIIDEYHKMGLGNKKSQTTKAVRELQTDHMILMSGTPMGGKPIKLWAALNLLHPEIFTSEWRWAARWLEIEETSFYQGGQEQVKKRITTKIQEGKEEGFYQELQPHMIRRLKEDVLKELPPKQYVDIWAEMKPKQAKQYAAMAADAEVRIADENLSAEGILAEYMRLKQFAGAHQKVGTRPDGSLRVMPTTESGKLEHVMEILEERGIRKLAADEDPDGDEQVVIASQFSSMVDMIHDYLNENGIPAAKITGEINQKERTRLTRAFQDGEIRVMVMTTTAGGVAITLDKASTGIMLDETWNPDDQEQMEDRIHRGSRIHQVTWYYIRSKNTIEEYIKEITERKAETNMTVLDMRKAGLRATEVVG